MNNTTTPQNGMEMNSTTPKAFFATHRLLVNGLSRLVKREGDHWITQSGEEFHAGFVEKLPRKVKPSRKVILIPPGRAEELWRGGAACLESSGGSSVQ